ncbi:MAG: SPOR domain-containing protein [Flavobacteriaceae bacterium]
MDLVKEIEHLLYFHECVTVPDFGSFLISNSKAKVDFKKGKFLSPKRKVSFNALIKQNDGVLAKYISSNQNISYQDALEEISERIKKWYQKIKIDTLIFKNIGEFYLNTENKICFQAYNTKSFSHNFYGLEDFSRLPLNESELNIIINKETNTKNIVMDNDKKENLAFEPESKEPAKKGKFKLVAIITSLIVLSVCGYYFGNEYIQSERLRSTEIAQEKIKNAVQKATYDIGSISSLELNVKANIETVEDDTVIVEQGDFYSVIAGSFRDERNAEKLLKKLKSDGFDASFAKNSSSGLYRIAYGRLKTKREAYQLLNFVKFTLELDAWYLVE